MIFEGDSTLSAYPELITYFIGTTEDLTSLIDNLPSIAESLYQSSIRNTLMTNSTYSNTVSTRFSGLSVASNGNNYSLVDTLDELQEIVNSMNGADINYTTVAQRQGLLNEQGYIDDNALHQFYLDTASQEYIDVFGSTSEAAETWFKAFVDNIFDLSNSGCTSSLCLKASLGSTGLPGLSFLSLTFAGILLVKVLSCPKFVFLTMTVTSLLVKYLIINLNVFRVNRK